jgi:hypothetical protein
MLQFLNNMCDTLFKTFFTIFHNLPIVYHELSTNFMAFKLRLDFMQLKTFQIHVDFHL